MVSWIGFWDRDRKRTSGKKKKKKKKQILGKSKKVWTSVKKNVSVLIQYCDSCTTMHHDNIRRQRYGELGKVGVVEELSIFANFL